MKYALAVAALLLAGCASSGQTPGPVVPVRAVGTVEGTAVGPQVFVGPIPMNALVRVTGKYSYTAQPFPPYLTIDGDYSIVVEPLPGREAEAQRAVATGAILIRRAGVAGSLNRTGTAAAMRDGPRYLKPVPDTAPKPPPPPPPVEHPCPPVAACDCDPCSTPGACCVPLPVGGSLCVP